MQTAGAPSRSECRPANMPKLSYRNSAQINPSQLLPREPPVVSRSPRIPESPSSRPKASSPRPSNSTFASSKGSRPSTAKVAVISPQIQKKKSLFSSLFVKEPTSAALDKVAAQLIAQHGELSPRAVPGVSSQKLPDFVPKVNSKWDGVPEALKEREKAEKDRIRQAKRSSMAPTMRSTSAEGSRESRLYQNSHQSRDRRDSTSTMSSFDSRGRAAYQHYSQAGSSEDHRSASQTLTSNGAGNRRVGKTISTKSQSLRSPSGSSLPEITAFFPNDIPAPPALPAKYKSEPNTYTLSSERTSSTDRTRFDHQATPLEPQIDAVPEYTSSPIPTPRDGSPVTPSPQTIGHPSEELNDVPTPNRKDEAVFVSSGAGVLGPPATANLRRKPKAPAVGFLAGEARLFELPDDEPAVRGAAPDLTLRKSKNKSFPKSTTPGLPAAARVQQDLEKRPDSSRARLGLRASMLVSPDQTPWVWEDDENNPEAAQSSNPRLSMLVGQKKILSLGVSGKETR